MQSKGASGLGLMLLCGASWPALAINQVSVLHENSRSLLSIPAQQTSVAGSQLSQKVADIDGDGDVDIVAALYTYSGGGTGLVWLENLKGESTEYRPATKLHTLSNNSNFQHFEVVDFDKDGDLDIIGAAFPTTRSGIISPYQGKHIWLFKNQGNGSFAKQVISDEFGANQIAVADFNQDGRNDLVTALDDSAALWLQNSDGSFSKSTIAEKTDAKFTLAQPIDYNDDSYPDIVLSGNYYLRILQNNQDNTFSEQTIATRDHCNRDVGSLSEFDRCLTYQAGHLQVADINGDGLQDIAYSETSSINGSMSWLERTDDGFAIHRFPAESGADVTSFDWVDVDSDGDLDLTFAYPDNTQSWVDNEPTIGWYENRAAKGQPVQLTRHELGNHSFGANGATAADLNGDGVKEFLYSSMNQLLSLDPQASVQLASGFHRFNIDDGRKITVAGDETQTLELTVEHGTLSLADTDALTFSQGDGEDDRSITVSGSAEKLNNALDGLLYQPDAGYFGSDTVQFKLSDSSSNDVHKLPLWVLGVGSVITAETHFSKLEPVNITIKFTAAINGLEAGDFKVSGGAQGLDSLKVDSENAAIYHGTLTPVIFEDILIQLPKAAATGKKFGALTTASTLLVC